MSGQLKRLVSTVRGGVAELGNAVFGDKAMRLLDERIRDTGDALHQARADLDAAKARRIHAGDALATIRNRLAKQEATVAAQLAASKARQARSSAETVVAIEIRMQEAKAVFADHQRIESQLAQAVQQLQDQLRRLHHQADLLRATDSLQRAQASVARRQPGPEPHPEPATASANRKKAAARKPTRSDKTQRATSKVESVDDVIARIGRRKAAQPAAVKAARTTASKRRKEAK